MLEEILEQQRQREADMNFRHPWFNMMYNYIIAAVALCLVVSLVSWGVQIHKEHRDAEMLASARAVWEQERQAEADAKAAELAAIQTSEAAVMDREATLIAKAFYGIRNFIDKYHYSKDDLLTYARCIFNRVDSNNVNTVQSVVSAPEQFLAFSEKNPVLSEYYDIAYEAVEAWHNETLKPCDASYRYAELTERGIYLTAEFGADGYARRWRNG